VNLKEKRAAELAAAHAVVEGAKDRDLTPEETATVEAHVAEVKALDVQIAAADKSAELVKSLGSMGRALVKGDGVTEADETFARTLGDHFIKHAGQRLKDMRGISGATVSAPEWVKAAGDTQVVGANGVFQTPVLTQFDTTIVTGVRPRLVVADLLGQGTLSGNAISYFVESAIEGGFAAVAEGGLKPQIHIVDPIIMVDQLKKIAGWIKFTDEMIEDLAFYVSEINNRLLYELGRFEEQQLLYGPGTGSTLLGLLERVGVQTEASTGGDDNADAIFRAITKVSTGSGLDADGIVINPLDYQDLRLSRDANEQYFGGGFFTGQYGNGTMTMQPPVWGMRTVITPAIVAGTVLVGAFSQGATVYRKGGVRVESTNSHASDFISNLVTTRAEERIALAVRYPAGFVDVTLG
jgi:HK97 family phage major capsid protein